MYINPDGEQEIGGVSPHTLPLKGFGLHSKCLGLAFDALLHPASPLATLSSID